MVTGLVQRLGLAELSPNHNGSEIRPECRCATCSSLPGEVRRGASMSPERGGLASREVWGLLKSDHSSFT